MNDAFIELMMRRVSFPRLIDPAPSNSCLEKIYQTALRAPDHKQLKPWRFLVVKGDARNKLGRLFCQAAIHDDPELKDISREKYNNMPLRAPMIIVGISKNMTHPKVPVEEQKISSGVAIAYMLLALQSSGYGGIWRTGPMATHSMVLEGLGLSPEESITGFLYIGTPKGEAKNLNSVNSEDYFQSWS